MRKSLKARLDKAFQSMINPSGCPVCGMPEEMIMEVFVHCIDDPEDQELFPTPTDCPRCATCNKPSQMVFWEKKKLPEELNEITLAEDLDETESSSEGLNS